MTFNLPRLLLPAKVWRFSMTSSEVTWPGVISGLATYWMSDPQLVPFAASPNKVFVCRSRHVPHYRQMFTSLFSKHLDRSDHLFGFPIDTYGTWHPVGEKPRRLSAVQRHLNRLRENIAAGFRICRSGAG